jgi:hypothetical protein
MPKIYAGWRIPTILLKTKLRHYLIFASLEFVSKTIFRSHRLYHGVEFEPFPV